MPKAEVPSAVPSVPNANSTPYLPPEIAKIADAWNGLPEAIRAGINAMIAAAAGGAPPGDDAKNKS